MSERLTEHFTVAEFENSATAKSRGLDNKMPPAVKAAAIALCQNVLEKVRAKFGPVRITSGYRVFTPDSQHGKGEAADFEVTGVANKKVAQWIRDNLVFDQLILEAYKDNDPNAGWIHCSYKVGRARKQVLRTPTGGPPYSSGLP